MQIKLLRLGHSTRILDIPAGSTIGDAISEAGMATEGHSLSLNGLGAALNASLSDGDVVVVTPKIEGGRG